MQDVFHLFLISSSVGLMIGEDGGQGAGKTAVVLPIADYKRLLEDINDLAAVADRREEPTIPHDQFVQELRKDGLLPD